MKYKGLRGIISYDALEAIRNTNEWMGASARAIASYPQFALMPNPMFKLMSAWGRVTERSFARMVIKPDWKIPSIAGEDGQDHIIYVEPVLEKDFGDLVHFRVARRDPMPRKVLIIAPMSGHYATLTRSTVASLLPDCDVYITDWHNARDIPVSAGKFDIEDYTKYLVEFFRFLGPDTNVIAICQPAPLALAATAILAEEDPASQPRTLTLIGGPIDPDAAATEVTDFGNRMTMGELEHLMIQQVGFKYRGAGRMVYPGLAQLSSFIAMNAETHTSAFIDKIFAEARGEGSEHDRHNKFYDEYLSVMDMTAEFYLSTVERIFKGLEIAKNEFTVDGKKVDLGKIKDVAIMTVEGANDDISAPGQCVAALRLATNVPANKKVEHLEPGAGHYGIFAGKSWRLNIRPLVLDFIDDNLAGNDEQFRRRRRKSGSAAEKAAAAPAANGDASRVTH
ncbi:polyhydroxyalkanoate depolymerase [Paracoccus cavernae]|uniref:polyhydroxyalkanoate depolymerase n=1 Tax=Paracoccus cavernae TaxID=1571207 RepID=UPI0035F250E2